MCFSIPVPVVVFGMMLDLHTVLSELHAEPMEIIYTNKGASGIAHINKCFVHASVSLVSKTAGQAFL